MNYIKRIIEGIEKGPTEYKFYLDGDIFAVVNIFKTYRFLHIRHYRDETHPVDGVCYYSNHFEDLVKLLEKREGNLDHIKKITIGEFTQTVSLKKTFSQYYIDFF